MNGGRGSFYNPRLSFIDLPRNEMVDLLELTPPVVYVNRHCVERVIF